MAAPCRAVISSSNLKGLMFWKGPIIFKFYLELSVLILVFFVVISYSVLTILLESLSNCRIKTLDKRLVV